MPSTIGLNPGGASSPHPEGRDRGGRCRGRRHRPGLTGWAVAYSHDGGALAYQTDATQPDPGALNVDIADGILAIGATRAGNPPLLTADFLVAAAQIAGVVVVLPAARLVTWRMVRRRRGHVIADGPHPAATQ